MTSQSDNGNGKVTLAVLNTNILHLTEQIKPLSSLCTDMAVVKEKINGEDGLVKKVAAHETRMDDMDRRSNWIAGINTALTAIGSTIAAIIGAMR